MARQTVNKNLHNSPYKPIRSYTSMARQTVNKNLHNSPYRPIRSYTSNGLADSEQELAQLTIQTN